MVVYVWFMTVYETVREWAMTVWRTMRRIYFARTHIHFLYTYARVTTQTRMHKQKRGGAKIRVTTHTKSFPPLLVCFIGSLCLRVCLSARHLECVMTLSNTHVFSPNNDNIYIYIYIYIYI